MSGGKGGSTTSEITIPDYIENAARANLAKADDISRVGYTPYYGADVAAFNPMQQASFQNTADTANAFGMATPTSGTDIMGNMGRPNVYADGITGYSSAPMFQDSVDTLNYLRPAQAGLIDSFFVNPNAGFDATAEFQGRPGGSLMGRGMLDAPLVNTTDYGVDSAYYNQPMSAPAGGIAGQYQPTAGDYGSNSGYGTNYNPTAPAPAPVSGDLAGIRRNDNEDGIGGQGFVAPTAAEYEERANSYGRRIPSFIPGAGLINTVVAGSATTPEEIAYIRKHPGQDDSLVSKVFGTGKYEPYDVKDVVSNQVYASGVSGGRTDGDGYGDFNESGLGRNMNYDRFGNERTEIPTGTDMTDTYWNSTSKNWTSKSSGLPVGSVDVDDAKANATSRSSSKSANSSDRGSCVIATHAVNSGGFSTKDKREAIVWCVNALHGKWWGEAIRRGYRYLGQKKIEQGKAREHYGEFKDYIAFANGKKRTVKGAIHFAARTAQFFAIGLVKKDI